jgi:hypothetical protein
VLDYEDGGRRRDGGLPEEGGLFLRFGKAGGRQSYNSVMIAFFHCPFILKAG